MTCCKSHQEVVGGDLLWVTLVQGVVLLGDTVEKNMGLHVSGEGHAISVINTGISLDGRQTKWRGYCLHVVSSKPCCPSP